MADKSRKSTRVLFVGEAVTLAHVSRPLALALSLDPDRYDVHFACGDRYREFVSAAGIRSCRPLPTMESAEFLERLSSGRPLYSRERLREYVSSELRLFKELSPDFVVGDFRISLGISASLAKIPYAALADPYWSPYAQRTDPVPEIPVVRFLGLRLVRSVAPWIFPAIFRHHARAFNAERRFWKLPPLGSLREIYTHGTWTLYAGLPSLTPMRPLPATHRFLGPILWEPELPLPDWWERLPRGRPLVYATLGSSGNSRLPGLVVRALAGGDNVGMLATAARGMDLGPLPENVFAADYLPGLRACQRAAVVVCNGGSPTVYQALSRGVPVLGLPSNMDQHLMMESVARRGAGILIRSEQASPENIREAVGRLSREPGHRERAAELQQEVARFDARRSFAEFLKPLT